MSYTKLFDPEKPARQFEPSGAAAYVGDRRDGAVYVYTDEIVLAVNVALAANRPLLVGGPPGSGKSSLAASIAAILGWRYDEDVISSRTQAHDLLWRFDVVRRLRDAQAGSPLETEDYVERGVLWRAFAATDEQGRTVVLLDEIDKADPDVPDNLLVPLGSFTFVVGETGEEVRVSPQLAPLVVITTNGERELSRPFLRRCVSLLLTAPDVERLVAVARSHDLASDGDRARRVAEIVVGLRDEAAQQGLPLPSTAEFLDALRACDELGITPDSPEWDAVERVTLAKGAGFVEPSR